MPENSSGFNLVEHQWIPVLDADGVVRERSLLQVLADAPVGVEILGEVPTQSFAILRLLLAVLYRAFRDRDTDFCGPRDVAEWADMRQNWPAVVQVVEAYLDEHRHRFDLFHPEAPFFQVAGLRTAKGEVSGLDKLIIDVPNGLPYLTTRVGVGLERISAAEAARWLVHVQAFDPSGIRSGVVGDSRAKAGKSYPTGPGWAAQLGGVHLMGATLHETLMLNLIPSQGAGREPVHSDFPPWERPPTGPDVEKRAPGVVAPTGPVDLYTWQSRRVLLIGDADGVTGLVLSNGDKMEPQNRHAMEPMSAWRFSEAQTKKLGGTTYMPRLHDPSRVFWRGLEALLPKATVAQSRSGPQRVLSPGVLDWSERVASRVETHGAATVRVRAVGLVLGSNNSVVTDLVDDALDLPLALLTDAGGTLTQAAVDAVRDTETAVNSLRDLAARLAVAGGADLRDNEGPRARAAERAYAELDAPFRAWLAQLTGVNAVEAALSQWRFAASSILNEAGSQLVEACGPAAWVGRLVGGPAKPGGNKKILLDAGLAYRWFRRGLAKALPAEPIDQEEVRS